MRRVAAWVEDGEVHIYRWERFYSSLYTREWEWALYPTTHVWRQFIDEEGDKR